ncbi:MAG: glycosyltransferase family 4 protein [Beijerinckiaceae bacterium]
MTLQLGSSCTINPAPAARDPRRILMTVDAVGGVWRYTMDLARSLDGLGVRTALIGFGPPPSRTQKAEADASRIPLRWAGLPLDWMPGGLAAASDARIQIARAAADFKADLVHVNSLAYAGPEIRQAIVAVGHSCIPTWWRGVHDCEAPAQWRRHLRENATGLRSAAIILAPSQSHARDLQVAYGPGLDIRVVYNASAASPAFRRRREPLVFAAGRWWDEAKNARALDSAAELTRWPVLMAGSLQDPAGPRVSLNHARALGALDAATTREWMRRASVFASPSIYEPFGLAVLEAARASTPLVLADIATFRELWDGAALFAAAKEPSAFADAIERLMVDAGLRRRLARRARERAAYFTLERQAEGVLAAYRAALETRAGETLRSAI